MWVKSDMVPPRDDESDDVGGGLVPRIVGLKKGGEDVVEAVKRWGVICNVVPLSLSSHNLQPWSIRFFVMCDIYAVDSFLLLSLSRRVHVSRLMGAMFIIMCIIFSFFFLSCSTD